MGGPLRRACVAGESWGARCDLRLCFSSIAMAHSPRLTGVRLAAWRKVSLSYIGVRIVSLVWKGFILRGGGGLRRVGEV